MSLPMGRIACGLALVLALQLSRAAPPPTNSPAVARLISAKHAERAFEAANKLYEEGQYTRAAEEYSRLLDSGRASAALLFNTGNAWFKAGQLGRAIAAYRQAERLSPRDPDVLANLQFARQQRGGATLRPGFIDRALGKLSLNEWTWLAFGSAWGVVALLALAQLKPQWRAGLRNPTIALGGITGVFAICLGLAFSSLDSKPIAIVIAPTAEVRHGPLEESQIAFTARDGAELQVLDQKGSWVRVAAGPKQSGWLPREKVLLFGRTLRG